MVFRFFILDLQTDRQPDRQSDNQKDEQTDSLLLYFILLGATSL